MILTFITVKFFAPDVNTNAATNTATETYGSNSISMSNDDTVSINAVPSATQTTYTGTNTLSITNSCADGATVTLTTNSNASDTKANKLVRDGTDSLTKIINPTTGTSLVNNSWGYSINNGSTYQAVPTKDGTAATIYDTSTATSSTDTVNVTYGVKINNQIPAGTYTNDVVYTVAVKPACVITYVPVTVKYYLRDTSGAETKIFTEIVQLARGQVLDATNLAELASLGLHVPQGNYTNYRFSAVFTNWVAGPTITIPTDTSESSYSIEMRFNEVAPTSFKFTFTDRLDSSVIAETTVTSVTPGMTLRINDTAQLTSLGLTIPTGYNLYQFSSALTNWQGVTELTVPSEFTQSTYYITVTMNQAVIRLKIDFTNYADNAKIAPRQTITVPPGTTVDLDDEPAMEALGIERPECWAYRHMSSGYNNWQATRSLTFPSTGYAESYNITMAMVEDSSYSPSGLGCGDDYELDF
jgi:hypothetical protein